MHPQALACSAWRRARYLSYVLVAVVGVAVLVPGRVGAKQVEPLDVPQGPGPAPETYAGLDAVERIELGMVAQADRGFTERPIQAWALLEEGRRTADPALVARAIEAAPNNPAVRVAAAREGVFGTDPLGLIGAFGRSLPALVWLLTVGVLSAGIAVIVAAGLASAVGMARTLGLHGHALGHRLPLREPLAWPGALGALVVLALLPALGIGAGVVLAVAGGLAALRSPRGFAWMVGALLALSGVLLGPALDLGSRLVTVPVAQPMLSAAWRFDWSQPLPEDAARIEAAVAREDTPDPFLLYAWANALKHLGETGRAQELLEARAQFPIPLLEARATSLLGILRLARGDVEGALQGFERARSLGESATVLYNISQTYARNVDLPQREALYAAARDLDPDLVGRYAVLGDGINVHRYVIQEPLPLAFYLGRALTESREARALSHVVRERALGPVLPAQAWLLLPILGIGACLLRRQTLGRCRRCDRPMCSRCAPASSAGSCTRCERLFSARAKIDARVRKQQADLDRLRQRRLRVTRTLAALAFPGVGAWLEGRALVGALRATAAGLGIGLCLSSRLLPVPFEVGDAALLPLGVGACLAGSLYLMELWSVRGEILSGSRT